MGKEEINIKRYLFWALITLIIIISYLMLKSLLIAIMTSVILAYIIKPVYKKLSRKMPEKLAASITIFGVLVILLIFFITLINSLIYQTSKFLNNNNISLLLDALSKLIKSEIIQENIGLIMTKLGDVILSALPSTISYIPTLMLNIFIIFFTSYYLLLEWDKIENKITQIIPFKNKHELITKIKKRTTEIIKGTFLIALVEFILSVIVLKLLGIGPYLLLAFSIGLLAFIPAIGPAIVWIPLAIIEFSYGKYIVAIGIILLGIILSTVVDTLLRAKMLGKRTGTHPAIMLFGIIGGIQLFGIIGLIIGPLILTILITIIENIPKTESTN